VYKINTSDKGMVPVDQDTFLGKRVLREVRLLSHFHHQNILGLRDLIYDQHKIYLITDLMKLDLKRVIRDNSYHYNVEHIRFIMYQVLLGLFVLHSGGVSHRVLHPGNILLDTNLDAKICDFNLAKEESEHGTTGPSYITLRYYRAPECALNWQHFTKVVDVWSAGCVLAEMFTRQPLFPGASHFDQLTRILRIMGSQPPEEVRTYSSREMFNYYMNPRNKLLDYSAVPLESAVPSAPAEVVDLIKKMLTVNPHKRITAEQALRHPFFSCLFDEQDLINGVPEAFHFDNKRSHNVEGIQEMLKESMQRVWARNAVETAQTLQPIRSVRSLASESDNNNRIAHDEAAAKKSASGPGLRTSSSTVWDDSKDMCTDAA